MADLTQPQPRLAWLRELAVPALMVGAIAFYASDAIHLSTPALILPTALVVVIVAALLWSLASTVLRASSDEADDGAGDGEGEAAPGPILNLRPWALVALPALLIGALDIIGALAAFVTLVLCAQLLFDARAPLRSLIVAVVVAAPIYAFFAYFLYVRFPAGVLRLG